MLYLKEPRVLSQKSKPILYFREETVNLKQYLDAFAIEGLRTLVLASRKLEQQEFKNWSQKYEQARNLIDGKREKMEDLQDDIEKNLTIIGATAIEDKLQDQVRSLLSNISRDY